MSTQPPRNFGELWDEALRRYKKETKEDIRDLPIAKAFSSQPSSAEEVMELFQTQNESFESFRTKGQNIRGVLKPVVDVLLLIKDCAEGASDAVPGGEVMFGAIGVLLQATKGVSRLYDAIESLFKKVKNYLERVSIHLKPSIPPSLALMNILVDTLVQIFTLLTLATKYCNSAVRSDSRLKKGARAIFRRATDYFRVLVDKTDAQGILDKLEELTEAERLLVAASTYAAVRTVEPRVKFIYDEAVVESLRRWLNPPNQQPANLERKSQRNSCNWFFDNQFEEWKARKNGVYWVHGNAGAGKSVLCSAVIDNLKIDPTLFLAYFYFDFSDNVKQTCSALVSSLVFQLATCSEACQTYLRGKRQPSGSPTYDELLVMLSELLLLSGRTFIVIDALDECPESARHKGLLHFVEHLALDIDKKDIHVFVTSRPENDISNCLSPLSPLSLDFNDAVLHIAEVDRFVSAQLSNDQLYRWSDDLKTEVREVLTAKSNGMFLWVDLQLQDLKRCTPGDAKSILNNLPVDLAQTYKRILEKFPPHPSMIDRARRAFECVSFAQRPLSPAEILEVLSVSFDSSTGTSIDAEVLNHIETPDASVGQLIPGILEIVVPDHGDTFVQFIHFSVQEYLMSSELRNSASRAHLYSFNENSAAVTLAKICLMALDVSTPLSNLQAYADEYWYKHVTSRNEEALGELLGSFLRMGSPSFARWAVVRWRSSDRDTAFHCAARLGLCRHVESMLKNSRQDSSTTPADALINTCDDIGGTALHDAAAAGQTDMCRLLLGHGALADDTNNGGRTPLHRAAWEGHLDVARLLLEYTAVDGAEPAARCRTRDDGGRTVLYLAAWQGHAEVARLLLSHGALVDDADNNGQTPLHRAEEDGYIDVVRVLLEHRAKSAPPVPPLESELGESLRQRAEEDPADGPWRAIVEDFAAQFEAAADGDDTSSQSSSANSDLSEESNNVLAERGCQGAAGSE